MCKTHFCPYITLILLRFFIIIFSHSICAKNVDDVENLCFQHPM